MQQQRIYVISLAGFDPSAGAGVLADIKTFEQLGVYGLGICTAITVQTEDMFYGVNWMPIDEILNGLQVLLIKYPVSFMKIGLIESIDALKAVLKFTHEKFPGIKIIWDPVLKASSGYRFHEGIDKKNILAAAEDIFLITPNEEEAKELSEGHDPFDAAELLSCAMAVFLKSHWDHGEMSDVLFYNDQVFHFKTAYNSTLRKHGSGCVISSAITAFLAKGFSLMTSCELAKRYTLEFLKSSEGLLGEHNEIKIISEHA